MDISKTNYIGQHSLFLMAIGIWDQYYPKVSGFWQVGVMTKNLTNKLCLLNLVRTRVLHFILFITTIFFLVHS